MIMGNRSALLLPKSSVLYAFYSFLIITKKRLNSYIQQDSDADNTIYFPLIISDKSFLSTIKIVPTKNMERWASLFSFILS